MGNFSPRLWSFSGKFTQCSLLLSNNGYSHKILLLSLVFTLVGQSWAIPSGPGGFQRQSRSDEVEVSPEPVPIQEVDSTYGQNETIVASGLGSESEIVRAAGCPDAGSGRKPRRIRRMNRVCRSICQDRSGDYCAVGDGLLQGPGDEYSCQCRPRTPNPLENKNKRYTCQPAFTQVITDAEKFCVQMCKKLSPKGRFEPYLCFDKRANDYCACSSADPVLCDPVKGCARTNDKDSTKPKPPPPSPTRRPVFGSSNMGNSNKNPVTQAPEEETDVPTLNPNSQPNPNSNPNLMSNMNMPTFPPMVMPPAGGIGASQGSGDQDINAQQIVEISQDDPNGGHLGGSKE